jgi:hypothetical protein
MGSIDINIFLDSISRFWELEASDVNSVYKHQYDNLVTWGILNFINYSELGIVNDIDGLHRYQHFHATWLAIPGMKANDVNGS